MRSEQIKEGDAEFGVNKPWDCGGLVSGVKANIGRQGPEKEGAIPGQEDRASNLSSVCCPSGPRAECPADQRYSQLVFRGTAAARVQGTSPSGWCYLRMG